MEVTIQTEELNRPIADDVDRAFRTMRGSLIYFSGAFGCLLPGPLYSSGFSFSRYQLSNPVKVEKIQHNAFHHCKRPPIALRR